MLLYCCTKFALLLLLSKLKTLLFRSEVMEKDMTEKKRITISLPKYVLAELESMANEKGVTKSILIMLALEEYKKGQKNA